MSQAQTLPEASKEDYLFENLDRVLYRDQAHAYDDEQVILLNKKRIPIVQSKLIPVQKGDVIDLETYVHYSKTKKRTWRKIGATVAGLAIGSLPYLLDKKDQRQEIGKVNRDLLKVAAPLAGAGVASLPFVLKDREGRPISPHVTMPTDRNGLFVPNAYLKYNLYDSQGILVKSAYQMIDKQAKDAWQKLYLHEEVQEDGFVSIELGNHSKQPTWFEAFKLTKRTYMDVNDSDKPEKIWALLRTQIAG